MGYLKNKLALFGREKPEAEPSQLQARPSTLYEQPSTNSSSSRSLKPSRPLFGRAVSAPVATKHSLAAEQPNAPVPLSPATLPLPSPTPPSRPVEPRIVLQMTKGPTILRSNIPKKVPEYVGPKTARKSVDARPSFGHMSTPFSSSVSMPALSELVSSPSTTSITIIPPSPPTATPNATIHDTPSAPFTTEHQASSLVLPATTPALEQSFTFSANVASLPSPTSEYGGDLYTPSPSLGSFNLPDYPTRRPVASSCIPEETSSDGSPSSIRSRMEAETAIIMTARLVKLPSRAVLREFNSNRPITLDLSSATRKPNHMRQVSAGPSRIAGSPVAPTSPNYARPLPMERLSPPSTPRVHSRSTAQGLEVDVEELVDQDTPPASRNPFQGALDFMVRFVREAGVDPGVDEEAVGAAH